MEEILTQFTDEENKRLNQAFELIGDLPVVCNIYSGVQLDKLRGFRKDKYVKIMNNQSFFSSTIPTI